jgi:hypothetical protein
MKKYIFIIDTNEYAGNFERELCAYITGHVGECGVGSEMAHIFTEEEGESFDIFGESVLSISSEHGCARPTSIWENKNGKYDSVAIFFCKKPTKKQIDLMKKRTQKFIDEIKNPYTRKPNFSKILGFRLLTEEKITNTIEESL